MAPPDGSATSMGFLWWSARNPPQDPRTSFAGKTVLITGANVGLGYEAFVKIAALGASRIVLGMRSLARGEAAKAQVCQRTGYDPSNIAIYPLDMSTIDGVKKFASEVLQHESRIDIALLNAGMAAHSHEISNEGYEKSIQVNVLSTALLALLLLPKLRAASQTSGSPSYLEIVGSVGHHEITPTDLNFPLESSVLDEVSKPGYFQLRRQYCITKLLVMYVMDGLVQVQEQHGGPEKIIIDVACPSLCRSNIAREASWLMQLADGAFKRVFGRSTEEGSRTLVSGVTLGKEAHGQFWTHDVIFRKGEMCTSAEGKQMQQRVWKEIMGVLQSKAGLGAV